MSIEKQILIVKTGSTNPEAAQQFGDYDERFVHMLAEAGVTSKVVSPFDGDSLPESASQYAGIIVPGSRLHVSDDLPWMRETAEWLFTQADKGIPVLGVCFGFQLLAHYGGGKVVPNDKGVEFGSHEVHLSEEGQQEKLFEGIDSTFIAQQYHYDSVEYAPEGSICLAKNDHTACQGARFSENIIGIQWHPEITSEFVEALWKSIDLEGPIKKSEAGERLIQNWLTYYIK